MIPGEPYGLLVTKIFSNIEQSCDYVQENNLSAVHTVCESLGLSPASKILKLNKTQHQSALKSKTKTITNTIKRKLKLSFKVFCRRSLYVISGCLNRNTPSVHTFKKFLVEDVKTVVAGVEKIVSFSDGASSQYKNIKIFSLFAHYLSAFGIEAKWNLFASSHGKNACDGIGGTIKRAVTKVSLQRPYND